MSLKTYYQEEDTGVIYERASWMVGGGWNSYERGINPGTVREINGILSKAYAVEKRGWFRKSKIFWISIKPSALRDVPITERPEESK